MHAVKKFARTHGLLTLLISLVYLPFLGSRLIRTTGDEKVYIAQALEMLRNGSWFFQLFAGEPNYYKGPGHYLLIQLGVQLFGHSLWAALYMNFLFCLIGALSVAQVVLLVFPEKKSSAFWAGSFFAFNVGISGYLFASQMEVELAGLYSLGFFLLWKSRSWRGDLLFWLVAGACGWFKSPLHSVLMGLSAVLFWVWNGEFFERLKNFRNYLTVLAGVVFCAAAYAPAFFWDHKNFWELYIQRETLKGSNGGAWWQASLPMVSYYLIPWMSLAAIAYLENLAHFVLRKKGQSSKSGRRFFKWAVSGIIPTLGFFTYFAYREEYYGLPVVASVVGLLFYLLKKTEGSFPRFRSVFLWITGLLALPIVVLFTAIHERFAVSMPWWPGWVIPLAWFLALGIFIGFIWDYKKRERATGYGVAWSKACFILIVNLVLLVFGEMEVYSLKNQLRADRLAGETYRVTYWNLNHLIWNESGLMSLAVREPITPLFQEAELLEAIRQGDLILGRDTEVGKEIAALAQKHYPDLEPITVPWDRWKTHASDGDGNSLIPKAWKEKNLSLLFDHALILRFKKRFL